MKHIGLISIVSIAGLLVVGSLYAGATGSKSIDSRKTIEHLQAAQTEGLQIATLKVSNMYCAACPTIVRRTLEDVDGVVKADVSYRTKQATVTFDPTKSSSSQLTAAVSDLGYPASIIK
ncbi:cation transporter [uncultured Sneathiella sp.]|jgi:mercuric ion binding protein|uniref:heavy-metal-associated domain-containing protein n=1 Tax=uncultured Sneathiella sp. TaxID=879315 RepID=UPI0030D8F604|tara:strand:- start:2352 stop:2708 length:357 start_codon:yes stop_codon:yes gene_type:complete